MQVLRREYKTGSAYAIWRWKDIYWQGELYLRRLILVQCPLFSIMLHWIKQPDKQRHLHDHPVSMLSIILRGAYLEQTGKYNSCNIYLAHVRKWYNWIPYTKAHKIFGVCGNVITLCFVGPRKQEWGFYTENGKIPWKEYHKLYDSSTS